MSKQQTEVQALYEEAVQRYRKNDLEGARPLVEQALAQAPDDLALHLLAGHVAHGDRRDDEALAHFELILDRDIHYLDTLHADTNPDSFANLLLLAYSMRICLGDDGDAAGTDVKERHVRYGTGLLAAGRPIPALDDLVEALVALHRYDEVIGLGRWESGQATAEELGLPGLDVCERGDFEEPLTESVMDAFFASGRHREGFEWIRSRVEAEPDDGELRIDLGEAYSWLGMPEETARQWVIGVRLDPGLIEIVGDAFAELLALAADPDAARKHALWSRLHALQDEVPPERKDSLKALALDISRTIGDPGKPAPSEEYLEAKLGMPLRPYRPGDGLIRHRLLMPWTTSPDPAIQAARANMAKTATGDPASATTAPAEAAPAETAPPSKIAVKAGAGVVAPHFGSGHAFTLERYGVDLTEQARKGKVPPIVGRDVEIDRTIRVLTRMEKNNPALVGEAGVGKTAVVQGLARRIAAGDVPAALRGKRIVELSMGVLVAGTTFRGDFEKRITDIVKEAQANPEIILFIDELHTVIGAGSTMGSDMDAADMLKPALARGELRLIGATTSREFSRSIERDAAMERRLSPIWIKELDRAATLDALKARRGLWESHHGVTIGDGVLAAAVKLSDARLRHRRFPDKAIDLVDESCALLRALHRRGGDGAGEAPALTEEHLLTVLGEWTGTAAQAPSPASAAALSAPASPSSAEVESALRTTLAGHATVVRALAELACALKAGVKEPTTPVVLLFYGPAGSGKSEAARAMARALWPDETDRFLVLNMEDYAEASAINRLIGVPAGYAGHDEGGLLSLRLKRQPASLIQLRNVQKADRRVLDLFAELVKEGAFTDARGNLVATHDALFILTADLDRLGTAVGFLGADAQAGGEAAGGILERLEKEGVPARLLAQVLESHYFAPLDLDDACEVIRLHLRRLADQPALRRLDLELGEDRIRHLAEELLRQQPERRNIKLLLQREIMLRAKSSFGPLR